MALNYRKKITKQEVLHILRDRILYLELKPGASISDVELAEGLEVSRTPVREALLLLSQEHLVNIYPQSGTFVAPIDLCLVQEIIYIRHILECEVLSHLAEQHQVPSKELLHSLNLQELAIQEDDQKAYVVNDHQFHQELFALGGHARTWDLIRGPYMQTTRFHILDFQHSKDVFTASLNEHRAILACLEAGDKAGLIRLLNVHHDCDLRTAESLKMMYPNYFLK